MKKLFTILTVIALSTTVSFSQNEAGTIALGATNVEGPWTSWGVSPVVGYFVTDGMMVGSGFSMESGDNAPNEGMSLSPFLRYYLKNSVFAHAGLQMIMPKGGDAVTNISLGLNLSLMWMERVAIEPGISLTSGEDYMGIGMNLGISFRLGKLE